MYDEYDRRWGSSGQGSEFREYQFDLDDEDGIINVIAHFKYEFPNAEISLHKIEDWDYDERNCMDELINRGYSKVRELQLAADKRIKEETAHKLAEDQKRRQDQDLALLAKLKEKYEKGGSS